MKDCFRIALMLAALSLITGCGIKSASRITALLPESDQVQGWRKVSGTRTFNSSNLWEHINGGAEKYIKEGLNMMKTSEYLYCGRIEAVASIYIMNSKEGAQKVFKLDLPIDDQRIGVGSDAQVTRSSLTFWMGPYYVRLIAVQDLPEVKEALVELGRGIEGILKQDCGK